MRPFLEEKQVTGSDPSVWRLDSHAVAHSSTSTRYISPPKILTDWRRDDIAVILIVDRDDTRFMYNVQRDGSLTSRFMVLMSETIAGWWVINRCDGRMHNRVISENKLPTIAGGGGAQPEGFSAVCA